LAARSIGRKFVSLVGPIAAGQQIALMIVPARADTQPPTHFVDGLAGFAPIVPGEPCSAGVIQAQLRRARVRELAFLFRFSNAITYQS
jgi:hypothetical protein